MTALMKILKHPKAQTLPPPLQKNTTVSGVEAVIMIMINMITFLLLTPKRLFLCFSLVVIHPNIHRHVYFTR